MELATECLRAGQQLPVEERLHMVDQIVRASVAIPALIAGADQADSRKRRLRYLDIARGKLKRLETLLIISREVGYLERDLVSRARLCSNELDGLLKTLITQLAERRWD